MGPRMSENTHCPTSLIITHESGLGVAHHGIFVLQRQITGKDYQQAAGNRMNTGHFFQENHAEDDRAYRLKVAEDCGPVRSDILKPFKVQDRRNRRMDDPDKNIAPEGASWEYPGQKGQA